VSAAHWLESLVFVTVVAGIMNDRESALGSALAGSPGEPGSPDWILAGRPSRQLLGVPTVAFRDGGLLGLVPPPDGIEPLSGTSTRA
jgi:hypothetical protein